MGAFNLVVNNESSLGSEKTFLREIRLNLGEEVANNEETSSGGSFWNKVFKQHTRTRESSTTKVCRIKVDVGGWLNLPPHLTQALSLLVVYEDRMGEHCILVDEMNARGATQILLAGSAEVQISGKVRSMAVYCGGIEDKTIWIDDMHIKTEDLGSEYISIAS